MQYVERHQDLRRDLAQARPGLFLAQEVVRHAALMALILLLMDATPWTTGIAVDRRAVFVVGWAVLVAPWSFWRLRRSVRNTRRAST